MPEDREQLLERYLDGELNAREQRALNRALREAPDLREQIALQRRIDAALRDVFAAGRPEPAVAGRIDRGQLTWRRLGLYAAALVLVALAGLWVRSAIHQRTSFNPLNSPERIYQRLVQGGFEPEFICEPGPEFIAAVEERFGEGLNIAEAPGVDVIGWAYRASQPAGAYGQILSDDMLILMAYVEREPVIVLMDRTGADSRPRLAPDSDLHQFRRRMDGFVLYEVTPHPRPRLLREFEAP